MIFFIVSVANGFPELVGIDISTIQRRRLASVPEEVAWDAEDGSITCILL